MSCLYSQVNDAIQSSEFNVVSLIPGLSDIKLGSYNPFLSMSSNNERSFVGLAGIHQLQNANIAAYLARSFLRSRASDFDQDLLPESFVDGLKNTKWPGRCQTVADPNDLSLTWYLDGAHTLESLECCMQWFASPDVGLKT